MFWPYFLEIYNSYSGICIETGLKIIINIIIFCYVIRYMARLVKKEDRGPIEVKVGNESKWICMCGLSNNQPFCDGWHKKTTDEEQGKIYRYNPDGTRTEIQ